MSITRILSSKMLPKVVCAFYRLKCCRKAGTIARHRKEVYAILSKNHVEDIVNRRTLLGLTVLIVAILLILVVMFIFVKDAAIGALSPGTNV